MPIPRRLNKIANFGNRGHVKRDNDIITCRDGFELSVIAGGDTYSSPRTLLKDSTELIGPNAVGHDYPGPYTAVDVMPYGDAPATWSAYRQGDVYAHVPVELVRELIREHGGEA